MHSPVQLPLDLIDFPDVMRRAAELCADVWIEVGKTLGVIGAGRVGTNFAKKSKSFEMKVLYNDLKRNEDLEKETGATNVSIPKF